MVQRQVKLTTQSKQTSFSALLLQRIHTEKHLQEHAAFKDVSVDREGYALVDGFQTSFWHRREAGAAY